MMRYGSLLAIFVCLSFVSISASADEGTRHVKPFPYFTDFEKKTDSRKHHNDNPHSDWRTNGLWDIAKDRNGHTSHSGQRHLDSNPKNRDLTTRSHGDEHKSKDKKGKAEKKKDSKNKKHKNHEKEDDESRHFLSGHQKAIHKHYIQIPADANLPVLTFWHQLQLNNSADQFRVELRVKGRGKHEQWAILKTYTLNDNITPYSKQTILLSGFKGKAIQIAFVQEIRGGGVPVWLIDDLAVEEAPDMDKDGIPDYEDPDRDGDGIKNTYETQVGTDPNDPKSVPPDLDKDGVPDSIDMDRDGDSFLNAQDAFPDDPTEWSDIDRDGIGDNADPDKDGDGISNDYEVQAGTNPADPNSTPPDLDKDGIPDSLDDDRDGDGYLNVQDAFPDDASEWSDIDSDGIGDNTDLDRDGDGISNDYEIQLGFDPDNKYSAPRDLDKDGIPDTVDDDRDGDGVANTSDAFPDDPAESSDLDKDGIGDNIDVDRDGDGVPNQTDAFPNDPTESADLDNDAIGDNADTDRDGDGVLNEVDLFPTDPTESLDADGDGIGNNSDPDIDGDGIPNISDVFPTDPNESADLDKDGIGDNSDADRDGDGYNNDVDEFPSDPTQWKLPVVKITSPQTLVTIGTSPVLVSGTLDDLQASLTVNGAAVSHNGGAFQVSVSVEEGLNNIIARAIDAKGNEVTASIVVSLDMTPPYVTIESPSVDQIVSTPYIAVSGLINDIVRGTVSEGQANVAVNGVPASVSNRSYLAENVPLQEGENIITVLASDSVGNTNSATATVTYQVPGNQRIEPVSGQGQTGSILDILDNPLNVRVLDKNSKPVVDEQVIFRVIQGDGVLKPFTTSEAQGVVSITDANGIARTTFKLGSRAGNGIDKVRATAVGFDGEVIFHANATSLAPNKVTIFSGNNQRGATKQPLPQPLIVTVSDKGGNVVQGAEIEFQVTRGSGKFQNGAKAVAGFTDSDGRASAELTLGSEEGMDFHTVTAKIKGTNLTASFAASALIPGDPGATTISGVVLDNQDNPLPGVTVRIDGATRQAVADDQGQFTITQAPVGPVHLLVDGSTNTVVGEWPTLSYNLVTVAGANNTLPAPIYMVKLDTNNKLWVGDQDVIYTRSDMPGLKMEIKAGSATFPDGSKQGYVSISPVNSNKVPMPPPNGMQPQLAVTIQPSGTMFDPPAKISMPNLDGLAPGTQIEMTSYDHDLEQFVTIGLGTVSNDGSIIKSNPGVGVIKAGWYIIPPKPPEPSCATGGPGGGCDYCQKNVSTSCDTSPQCVADPTNLPTNKCKTCSTDGNGTILDVNLTSATATANGKKELIIPLGENGAEVSFEAQGVGENCNSYSYEWDFGNRQTSTQQNPKITFSEPGVYDAKVVVKCGECDAQEKEVSISLNVVDIEISNPLDDKPIEIITAEPKMPEVAIKAKILGWDGSDLSVTWSYVVKFEGNGGSTIKSWTGNSTITTNYETIWNVQFGNIIRGGNVYIRANVNLPNTTETLEKAIEANIILGRNPERSVVLAALGSDIFRAIGWSESGFRQFENSPGLPYASYAADGGFGIMQPTPASAQEIWSWTDNVARGQYIYSAALVQSDNHLKNYNSEKIEPFLVPLPDPPITMTEEQRILNALSLYKSGLYYYRAERIGETTLYQLVRRSHEGANNADTAYQIYLNKNWGR